MPRKANISTKWQVWVTDRKGNPIKADCRLFDKKQEAVDHAKTVYHESGNGRTKSTYIFAPETPSSG